MDEHREEREELAALAREQADDVREQDEAREYWADVSVAFQTSEEDAQRCLERSGLTVGSLLGETMIVEIELR